MVPVRRPSAGLLGYLASLQRRSAGIRELSVRFHLTSQTENDKVGAYMIGNIVVSIIVGLAVGSQYLPRLASGTTEQAMLDA